MGVIHSAPCKVFESKSATDCLMSWNPNESKNFWDEKSARASCGDKARRGTVDDASHAPCDFWTCDVE